MNLGELKKSLGKFPGDFFDSHVMFITKGKDGEREYHLLAGVGQIIQHGGVIALISDEVCKEMIENGDMNMQKDLPDDFENLS